MASPDDLRRTAPSLLIDLADESTSQAVVGGRADVLLLSGGVPLARRVLRVPASPLDRKLAVAQLGPSAALRHLRSQLLPAHSGGTGPLPACLVVAATASGPALARCLRSAADLAPAVERVVVVDLSEGPAGVRHQAGQHAVQYVRAGAGPAVSGRPGLAAAGVVAVEQLEIHGVLMVVSADARLAPGWAGALYEAFADPVVAAATGLVLPGVGGAPEPGRALDSDLGLDPVCLDSLSPTAVMAVARPDVAVAVRSHELLATSRQRHVAGGVGLVDALLDAGHRIAHNPRALAFTDVPTVVRTDEERRRRTVLANAHALRRRRMSSSAARNADGGAAAAAADGAWLSRLLDARPRSVSGGAARSELPHLSVVIPSRGRRDQVVELVRCLQDQAYDDHRVEVVVALDGDVDGSAAALEALDLARPLRLVHLEGSSSDPAHGRGAGVARNAGAAAARGELLLFLDDDVQPVDDDLLLAHARGQAARPGSAHVGLCPPRTSSPGTRLEQAARRWWADQSMRLLRGAALDPTDVATANLSLSKAVFLAVGGFTALPRREDWELGQRLLTSGVGLHALPAAAVLHDLHTDVPGFLADVRREGAGDALMAEMHPAVVGRLALHAWRTTTPRRRRLMRLLLEHAPPSVPLVAASTAGLAAVGRATSVAQWHRALGLSVTAAYWSGVGDALGSLDRLTAIFDATDALAERGCGTFEARTGALQLPSAHQAAEIDVVLDGTRVGRLPVRAGGVPFQRERFVDAVLERWAPDVLVAHASSDGVPAVLKHPAQRDDEGS